MCVDFRKPLLFICIVAASALTSYARAQSPLSNERDPMLVTLKGGIEIALPALPTEESDLTAFRSLSEQEREAFYYKRAWLIQKLAGGLAKPGIGRAIRWTKGKVTTTVSALRSRFSVAERVTQEDPAASDVPPSEAEIEVPVLEFTRVPDGFSENTKAVIETTVTSLVNNMWANSVGIARSSGIGMSFVVGVIWNTTLGKYGIISGRSLSVDIGMDFKNDRGYINFFIDKQTKSQGGISFDIGTMFDVLVHITDPKQRLGTTRLSLHQKLPVIGCFRHGSTYRAWGSMIGVHVLEVAASVMMVMGYPEAGFATLATVRGIGFATMYRTNLEQRLIGKYRLSRDNWLIQKLKFNSLREGFKGRTCRSLFTSAGAF